MIVCLNGKSETVEAGSLMELVIELGLNSDSLVVEYNRRIVRQEAWAATTLREGDEIELLSFVGGG